MTASLEMPAVAECTVSGCSYNDHSGCHAYAVTIGGSDGDAECATFLPLQAKGGLPMVTSKVGACQRADCVHNSALECTAASIKVGSHDDTADCLTYTAR